MKLVTCCLFLWLSASLASAQIKDFESKRQQGTDLRLEGLKSHAVWLLEAKLTGTRLGVLKLILEVDPDNANARRSLGYKPKKKGGWIEPKRPKRSKDHDPQALKQEPGRRARTLQPFVDHHLTLLKQVGSDMRQRGLLADDIRLVAPHNAALHEILDEVQLEEGWVPREVALAKKQRALMAKTLAAAMQFEAKSSPATEEEAAFGLPWKAVLKTPLGRLCGTVKPEELQTCAKQLQGLMALYRLMYDSEAQVHWSFGVYLMKSAKEGKLFLAGLDGLEDADRPALLKQRGIFYNTNKQIGHWSTQADERLDAIVRMLLRDLFKTGMGVRLKIPWMHEGFGMYLGFRVTGSRKTWFLPCLDGPQWTGESFGKNELSAREQMLYAKDWRLLGAEFIDRPTRPTVSQLIEAKAEEFSSAHLLYSYLFAAFLSEAYPKDVAGIIRDVASGVPADTVFKRRLGKSPADLDLRLQLWLQHHAVEHAPKDEE